MMVKKIFVASTNKGKILEIKEYLFLNVPGESDFSTSN